MASFNQIVRSGVAAFALFTGVAGGTTAAQAQTRTDARVVAAELRELDYERDAEIADCNMGYFDSSNRLGRTLAVGPEVEACRAEANYDHSYGRYRILLSAQYFNEAASQLQDAYIKRERRDDAEYRAEIAKCNGRQIDGFSRRNQDLGDVFRGSARNGQCTANARSDRERNRSQTATWINREISNLERQIQRSRGH